MHAFNPGPFLFAGLAAAAVLVLCLLLLCWVPRARIFRGWGQIGAIYLLIAIAVVAAVIMFIAGGAWWLLV